jgi:hypothetical protein
MLLTGFFFPASVAAEPVDYLNVAHAVSVPGGVAELSGRCT